MNPLPEQAVELKTLDTAALLLVGIVRRSPGRHGGLVSGPKFRGLLSRNQLGGGHAQVRTRPGDRFRCRLLPVCRCSAGKALRSSLTRGVSKPT